MDYFLEVFRNWDGSLSQIFDLFIYIFKTGFHRFGWLGVFAVVWICLLTGMKSDKYGHFFSLVNAGLVRGIGMAFSFIVTGISKFLIFIGVEFGQAAMRQYADSLKDSLNTMADEMKENTKKNRKNKI